METANDQSMEGNLIYGDDQHRETAEKSDAETVNNSDVVDLSGSGLRKLEKSAFGTCRCLILDRNELTKLENIESYGNLRKLSLKDNKFVRMYCVCRLIHLRELDLSNNCLVVIEGLRELIHLNVLRLAGNKIRAIEHISTNIALEILDLSNNSITSLADLSHLKMLHTLLLNTNNIKQINGASTYLPGSIQCFNIANNLICDLNQVSNLTGLSNLDELVLQNNPCVDLSRSPVGFDYRPFVVSWCQTLKLLDEYVVSSKESLKAEWLYSMGKGRQFRIGDHADLIDYLSNICPLTSMEDLTSEEDVKLNRILKQRRQLQQQLLVEMTTEDRTPLRLPSAPLPASPSKSSLSSESIGLSDRSKSALPVRTHGKAPAVASVSSSAALHFHSAASTSRSTKSTGGKKHLNLADANDGVMDATDNYSSITSHDFHEHHNGVYENEMSFYTSHKGEVPSDVPESSYVYKPVESPVTSSPLKSETQYVPVPETMLSPDFRPISNSFHAGMYEGELGGDGETEFPHGWSSWSQGTQSSIPRNVTLPRPTSRASPRVSNDWPVAKRPTQVQRVQKTTRPLSLSPSNYRRSPAPKHKSSPRATATPRSRDKAANVDDSSSDSDMSISKLVLVKEAIARKSKDTISEPKRNQVKETKESEDPKQRLEHNGQLTYRPQHPPKKERNQNSKLSHDPLMNNTTDSQRIKAAIRIQSIWRGYIVRQKHPEATSVRLEIRLRRAEDHVKSLQKQLTMTQEELACEKRFRSMQMDAIQSLWVQVQQLQSNYLQEKSKTEDIPNLTTEYKADPAPSTKEKNGAATLQH